MKRARTIICLLAWLPALVSLLLIAMQVRRISPGSWRIVKDLYDDAMGNADRVRYLGRFSGDDYDLWWREGARLREREGWGRVLFGTDGDFPGIRLSDYTFGPARVRDWRPYHALSWEMRAVTPTQELLFFVIKDADERRFEKAYPLSIVTTSRVTLDLWKLRPWMDCSRIAELHFYMKRLDEPVEVALRGIRLEKRMGEDVPNGDIPFVFLEELRAPPVCYPGETIEISAVLGLKRRESAPYHLFLHLFPDNGRDNAVPSTRPHFLHVEKRPFVPTPQWEPGVGREIGPFSVFIPYSFPPGRCLVRLGLFNAHAPGKAPRDRRYRGSFDYRGSYPRCRYVEPALEDFVVGTIEVVEE